MEVVGFEFESILHIHTVGCGMYLLLATSLFSGDLSMVILRTFRRLALVG